jgi:hypothetical protein
MDLIRVRTTGDTRLHVCKRCSKRSRWRIRKVFPVGECSVATAPRVL